MGFLCACTGTTNYFVNMQYSHRIQQYYCTSGANTYNNSDDDNCIYSIYHTTKVIILTVTTIDSAVTGGAPRGHFSGRSSFFLRTCSGTIFSVGNSKLISYTLI